MRQHRQYRQHLLYRHLHSIGRHMMRQLASAPVREPRQIWSNEWYSKEPGLYEVVIEGAEISVRYTMNDKLAFNEIKSAAMIINRQILVQCIHNDSTESNTRSLPPVHSTIHQSTFSRFIDGFESEWACLKTQQLCVWHCVTSNLLECGNSSTKNASTQKCWRIH